MLYYAGGYRDDRACFYLYSFRALAPSLTKMEDIYHFGRGTRGGVFSCGVCSGNFSGIYQRGTFRASVLPCAAAFTERGQREMNFITPEFVLSLPVALLLYRLLPQRGRQCLLLIISAAAYIYWNGLAAVLLFTVILVSWLGAKLTRSKHGKLWRNISVLLILSGLFVFKYLNFTVHLVKPDAPVLDIILPVGISFYTFQSVSYVLDVYSEKSEPEPNFALYTLFVCYFPQLVAGPIERADSLIPQLRTSPLPTREDIREGFVTLLTGFAMKLCIADPLSKYADPVFASAGDAGAIAVIVGTVCFAVQIYCDFAGYSAIAIGASRMFGIRLSENFNSPYLASSVGDFWHRWHISLTRWFTDYVYKPLGGNRRGLCRECVNIMVVFLLSGIWHGASFTFILWGVLHGAYMVIERVRGKPLPRAVTLSLVLFAWIFFRAGSVSDAVLLVQGLFTGWSAETMRLDVSLLSLDFAAIIHIAVLVLASFALPELRRRGDGITVFLLILAVSAGFISAGNAGESSFIYFRF